MEQQQKLQQQFSLLDKLSSGKKKKYQMEKVYRFIICKKATQRQTWSSQKTSKNILKICLLPNLVKISLTKKIQELKETPNEKGLPSLQHRQWCVISTTTTAAIAININQRGPVKQTEENILGNLN